MSRQSSGGIEEVVAVLRRSYHQVGVGTICQYHDDAMQEPCAPEEIFGGNADSCPTNPFPPSPGPQYRPRMHNVENATMAKQSGSWWHSLEFQVD